MGRADFSSDAAHRFDAHNPGTDKPVLQHCEDCGTVQYPSREVCRCCLSGALTWKPIADDRASIVASTTLHHSLEEHYLKRLPWHVLTARPSLGSIGSIFVHSAKPRPAGEEVRLVAVRGDSGAGTLLAVSPDDDADTIWKQLSRTKPG